MGNKLDSRLSLIFSMVPPCQGAADVGTDHGYLICALAASGKVRWGIATDLNPMPLDRARREAARQGLSHRVRTVLADGLAGVEPQGLGAVVAAGMGGETIIHVIGSWPHHRSPGIAWILQPMTKAERLREWLWGAGFSILREECRAHRGKIYSVMEARYTGGPSRHEEWELRLGRVDPCRDADSLHYARQRAEELERMAAGLRAGRDTAKTPEAERLAEAARRIRERMEGRQ